MKIPQSMMDDILKTVLASLPYEAEFEPVSKESKLIHNLFYMLNDILPEGCEGHLYFHLKHIDNSEKQQENIRRSFKKLFTLLEEYVKSEVDTE